MQSTINRKKFLQSSLLGLAIATLSGTTPVRAADLTEEFHKTYPLEAKGTVQLENINGKVEITGWDKNEVEISAVKRAKNQEQLDATTIEVDATADNVSIKTMQPKSKRGDGNKNKNNSTSVDYVLKVPKTARLDKIGTVNGKVAIEGIQGSIKAETVNGEVSVNDIVNSAHISTVNGHAKANVGALAKGESLSMSAVNGGLTLVLPSNTDAELNANTVNGSIHSDAGGEVKKHFPIGQNLKGTLGKGGSSIKMSTVNGGIDIKQN